MTGFDIGSRFFDPNTDLTWRVTGLIHRTAGGPATAFTAVCESHHPDDPTWHTDGPPYAVVEVVWDENDVLALEEVDWL